MDADDDFYRVSFSCFLFSNKIDKKFFIFFYFNSTVLYILFHLLQPMTVYPFEHTKELKQFMNMYTTS